MTLKRGRVGLARAIGAEDRRHVGFPVLAGERLAAIAEAQQPRVARIDEETVLIHRDDQGRTAPKQPLVLLLLRHAVEPTVFRREAQRKVVINGFP